MSYRTIFVHVDDSAVCARRLEAAVRLARKYSAELLAAYLAPAKELTPFSSTLLPDAYVSRKLRESSDAQRGAEELFRGAAAGAGLSRVTWHAPAGDPLEAAVLHARYSDLAVMGQPPRGGPGEAFAAELAKGVVLSCGRPVLFVPYIGTHATIGERVMIAWKDSRESARAVADALPLLKDATIVRAVAVMPEVDERVQDVLADRHVAAFLRRHAIEATVSRIAAPDADAGELLLSQAADFGADLIVMGGYSRSPLTELVLSGVTKLMLSSMTVPVLMSH
jgi:nucleotide-binding universal stress UspA family protein